MNDSFLQRAALFCGKISVAGLILMPLLLILMIRCPYGSTISIPGDTWIDYNTIALYLLFATYFYGFAAAILKTAGVIYIPSLRTPPQIVLSVIILVTYCFLPLLIVPCRC